MQKLFLAASIAFLCIGAGVVHAATLPSIVNTFSPLDGVAAVGGASSSAAYTDETPPASVSSGETAELIPLLRPAIVRIVSRWVGTTTLPVFTVEYATKLWKEDTRVKKPTQIPYQQYASGTGFVISSDGYIVTNSHVASKEETLSNMVDSVLTQYLFIQLLNFKDTTFSTWYKGLTADERTKLIDDGKKYVRAHMSFNSEPAYLVLTPTTTAATTTSVSDLLKRQSKDAKKILDNLLGSAVPASVIYVNDKFKDDEKDFAIIKVTENNLPFVYLGNSADARVGQAVYSYGYPSNANMGTYDGAPTLTAGSINSLRDSTQHQFKYIQTDTKISTGSSGSPLFDAGARVVGIITQIGGDSYEGDTFGFAIPIDIVKPSINETIPATPKADDYVSLLLQGMQLSKEKHCAAAIQTFGKAQAANVVFGDTSGEIQIFIDSCKSLIAAGKSIDGPIDYIKDWVRTKGSLFWAGVGGGVLLLAIIIVGFIFLFARLGKEEKLIEKLEEEIAAPAAMPPVPAATIPSAAVPPVAAPIPPQNIQPPAAGL
jgi:S1-C subfamily serine protease